MKLFPFRSEEMHLGRSTVDNADEILKVTWVCKYRMHTSRVELNARDGLEKCLHPPSKMDLSHSEIERLMDAPMNDRKVFMMINSIQ